MSLKRAGGASVCSALQTLFSFGSWGVLLRVSGVLFEHFTWRRCQGGVLCVSGFKGRHCWNEKQMFRRNSPDCSSFHGSAQRAASVHLPPSLRASTSLSSTLIPVFSSVLSPDIKGSLSLLLPSARLSRCLCGHSWCQQRKRRRGWDQWVWQKWVTVWRFRLHFVTVLQTRTLSPRHHVDVDEGLEHCTTLCTAVKGAYFIAQRCVRSDKPAFHHAVVALSAVVPHVQIRRDTAVSQHKPDDQRNSFRISCFHTENTMEETSQALR